jgi:hypothetical protein
LHSRRICCSALCSSGSANSFQRHDHRTMHSLLVMIVLSTIEELAHEKSRLRWKIVCRRLSNGELDTCWRTWRRKNVRDEEYTPSWASLIGGHSFSVHQILATNCKEKLATAQGVRLYLLDWGFLPAVTTMRTNTPSSITGTPRRVAVRGFVALAVAVMIDAG